MRIMSRTAAPVGEVTSAIDIGQDGIGFFRDSANRPSAASFAFSCSKATFSAPAPSGMISEM